MQVLESLTVSEAQLMEPFVVPFDSNKHWFAPVLSLSHRVIWQKWPILKRDPALLKSKTQNDTNSVATSISTPLESFGSNTLLQAHDRRPASSLTNLLRTSTSACRRNSARTFPDRKPLKRASCSLTVRVYS